MFDKSQKQEIGDNSKGLQAGRDIIYNSYIMQEKKDLGIIEKIFSFLFIGKNFDSDVTELSNGKGLKKIPLNFSGDSLQTINEIVEKTTQKRDLVKIFVNNQREIDESEIDALILRLQNSFRSLKGSENNYEEIKTAKIIEKMATNCIEETKRENPDYNMNALAIVLYFFEMCDFGKSEEAKEIQESLF